MAYWIAGIERPSKEDFEKHDRTIRRLTFRVSDPNFDSEDAFDTLQDVLFSANTVRNYYQPLLSRGSPKRHRYDADVPSDSEDTRRPSKMPRMPASKKRSRDVYSSENEETPRPSKASKTANKKRPRDTVNTSEDEGTSQPAKKARLGAEKVEMTEAVKELQDLINSTAKGSK